MLPSHEEVRRAAARERRARADGATLEKKRAVTKTAKKVDALGAKDTTVGRGKRPRSPTPSQSSPSSARRPRFEADIDLTADSPPRDQANLHSPPLPPPEMVTEPIPESVLEPVEGPISDPTPAAQTDAVDDATAKETADGPPMATTEAGTSAPSVPPPSEPADEGVTALSFKTLLEREGRWAERIMAQICLPELQGILQEQKTSTFFREAFVAHLWAANSLAALKDALSQAKAALTHSQSEAHQSIARAERAEIALEAARAEEEARAKRVNEVLAENQARMNRAEIALEAERRTHKDRVEDALERARVAEEKFRSVELDLQVCESSLDTANLLKHAAEERAENAEEIARASDARVAEMKAVLEAAEATAAEAVANFRQSAEFREELADATAFSYNVGFQDCKDKARRVGRLEDLKDLEPDEDEELLPPSCSPANGQPPEP